MKRAINKAAGYLGYKIVKDRPVVRSNEHEMIGAYWDNAFFLKKHIKDYLRINSKAVRDRFLKAKTDMRDLGIREFKWTKSTEFYRDHVGDSYLFELGNWHLTDKEQILGSLELIAEAAHGRVLDYGGGIDTHTLAAASCSDITEVVYCDINPVSLDFVDYRLKAMGFQEKVKCRSEVSETEKFNTIICFDVIEHLPNPAKQLLEFHRMLEDGGILLINWWFTKGENNEFPFHLDDPKLINEFFLVLQKNYVEKFHTLCPYYRCYMKT